jgi:hypothetical protein
MTTDVMTHFIEQRPFVPFTLVLANGREIHVPHSDFVGSGRAVLNVHIIIPTGQLEVVDTALILSIRTFHPAELPSI